RARGPHGADVQGPLGHADDAVDDDRAAHPPIVSCSRSPRAWRPTAPRRPMARTSVYKLASDGRAPAPRRPMARTSVYKLASDGRAPAPRRPVARTSVYRLASDGGAPAPRRPMARTTVYNLES